MIVPSALYDTVSTQQVNTEQVDTEQVDTDELILNEMVARRKLLCGNENKYARHAMERAVKETPIKSKNILNVLEHSDRRIKANSRQGK